MTLLSNFLHPDMEDASETEESTQRWEEELTQFAAQLAALPATGAAGQRAHLQVKIGRNQALLGRGADAWAVARDAFDAFVGEQDWEGAAQACDVMFRADQPDSQVALGHGIWLAVTYPVNPELTVTLLQHLVEETAPDSNVAPIAASAAQYVVDLRAAGDQREELLDYTQQLLTLVAGRHRGVQNQGQFEAWLIGNELDDPAKFLPRLGEAVENLVRGRWWIDRDTLRRQLPVS